MKSVLLTQPAPVDFGGVCLADGVVSSGGRCRKGTDAMKRRGRREQRLVRGGRGQRSTLGAEQKSKRLVRCSVIAVCWWQLCSIPQARQGTLYLMCGGSEETFNRVRPMLTKLSNDGNLLRYVGRAGQAANVKALVNMVMNINTAGLAEGLGLGAALGLDLKMLMEVFSQTGAASRVLGRPVSPAVLERFEALCYCQCA